MRGQRILVILNPMAGSGKGRRLWQEVSKFLDSDSCIQYRMHETRAQGDALRLVQTAKKENLNLIIVLGGDGTVNEVVNGLYHLPKGERMHCELGIINCGTGGGVAQSLGLPKTTESQFNIIVNHPARHIDIGVTSCLKSDGKMIKRYFINECQLGISGVIVSKIGARKKRWGGAWSFGLQAAADLLTFQATGIDLIVDGQEYSRKSMLGVVVGNGKYCAGGMQLTPAAKLNDGYLDLLTIGNMSLLDRLSTFAKVYRGSHVTSNYLSLNKIKYLEASSERPLLVETDGELIGTTPCAIKIIPQGIRVRY
ncbi:MAG: diacylglycerol kinase family lipid kinase [Saprospiraceae bacterium]|nr:diacylglycerol kinase family lipid kinase [Saprospiraceae bacterium]